MASRFSTSQFINPFDFSTSLVEIQIETSNVLPVGLDVYWTGVLRLAPPSSAMRYVGNECCGQGHQIDIGT